MSRFVGVVHFEYILRIKAESAKSDHGHDRCVDAWYYSAALKLTFHVRTLFQSWRNSSRPSFPDLSISIMATIERQTSLEKPSNSNSVGKWANRISIKNWADYTHKGINFWRVLLASGYCTVLHMSYPCLRNPIQYDCQNKQPTGQGNWQAQNSGRLTHWLQSEVKCNKLTTRTKKKKERHKS